MRLVDIGMLGAFAAMVVAAVVAAWYWMRTVSHRTPGVTPWAAVFGTWSGFANPWLLTSSTSVRWGGSKAVNRTSQLSSRWRARASGLLDD